MKSRKGNKGAYKNKKFLVVSPAAPSAANGNKRDSLNFNSHVEEYILQFLCTLQDKSK